MIFESHIVNFIGNEIKHNARSTLLVFSLALLCILIIQWIYKQIKISRSLPPGPWGLPIIGILNYIGSEKHTSFMKLAKEYGTLFSARLGSQLTVVISDYKLIREAFKREEFTGRPNTPLLYCLNGMGVINSQGKLWKDQRRFLHEKLRQFGMTYMGQKKKQMEKLIMTEVGDFLNALRDTKSQAVELGSFLNVSVSNVICNLLMSVRFTQNDPKFLRFTYLIEEGMRLFGKIHMIDYIPTTQYLPVTQTVKLQIAQNRQEMFLFYKEVIDEHRATFNPENCRDLVDTYLLEIQKAKEEGREKELFEGKDHEEQIMQVIGDLFSAGMETIKTTLLWMVVFMLRHPEAMRRVQEELDTIVGRDRLPNIEDIPFVPLTEATIYEVMRISSIVPLATTHTPIVDVELNGYTIPAGAHVVPLLNGVHMDPTLWDKPEEFRPTRFINAEGKVQKPEFFIPFGVGRRMCLGEVLARMELFLFFSTLLHSFNFKLPEGHTLPSLKGNVGVTISPDNFLVCLVPREFPEGVTDDSPLRNFGSY